MRLRQVLIAGAALAVCAGGLGLAQEEATERAAPPPPSEAPPPTVPPTPAAPPLADAVTPDEAAPPEPEPEPAPVAKTAAAASNNLADDDDDKPLPPPPPEPLKRPRYVTAILQAVEKSSAETLRFEARVGQPIRYKGLTMTVHACETSAKDETFDDSMAHVEMQAQPQGVAGRAALAPRQVFRGWMFASSPSLHPLEHPLYDVWLIACKTEAPVAQGSSL